jgi:hypothetical protein
MECWQQPNNGTLLLLSAAFNHAPRLVADEAEFWAAGWGCAVVGRGTGEMKTRAKGHKWTLLQ